MTFSDRGVAALVNRHFASAWSNLRPGFNAHEDLNGRFRDAAACRMIPEGHSDKNIVTVFATPELEVLHALPGYWQPARFLEEAEFVLGLRKEVLDAGLRLREDRKARFEALHRAEARKHDDQAERAKGERDPLGEMQRAAGYGRTKSELEKLLADVHRGRADAWAESVEDFEKAFGAAQVADFFNPRK